MASLRTLAAIVALAVLAAGQAAGSTGRGPGAEPAPGPPGEPAPTPPPVPFPPPGPY
jgi:hypothetical protein